MLNVVTTLQDRGASLLKFRAARAERLEKRKVRELDLDAGFAEPELDDELMGRLPEARPRSSSTVKISFLICVALPTLIASLYLGLIASNQYVSEFKFAVRASDAQPGATNAASAALGGAAKAGAFLDNFAVIEFVKSRQAIDNVEKADGLRDRFVRPSADYFSRLSKSASAEDLVTYWQSMIDATFDMTTGVGVVRVRAFTPTDALELANALMRQSEALVNEVNQRARNDAIRFAQEDMARAELRLKQIRGRMLEFRNLQKTADPTKDAAAMMDLGAKLRGDLAQLRAQLATTTTTMAANAPTVEFLRTKIRSTEEQLRNVAAQIGDGKNVDQSLVASQLARYEDLDVERQFAEKLWASNLTALETAKSNANMQHTYLAAFVQPALAEESTYPRRLLGVFLTFGVAGLIWICGLLFYYSIRDRVA